ncbi:MAG: hypothetical protein WCW44_02325 [archaeon]|jgi:hypothetical protein
MVKRILNNALKESNAFESLPVFASAEKVIDEIKEHFGLLKWSLKRVLFPIAIFYILVGFVLQEHVLGSLALALLVFLYTNFLPDLDAFFSQDKRDSIKANWTLRRLSLYFTPAVIYYVLSKKTRPIYLGSSKPFHNTNSLIEITIFLFLAGLVLHFSLLKAVFLALFGLTGYATHLFVDGLLPIKLPNFFNQKKKN